MSAGLLVEDAIEPVAFRVLPDAPLSEVVEIMVRERVGAIPVVGEDSEVMGIITSGDALEHVMQGGSDPDRGAEDRLTVRDVMTRTVLCVAEGQPLIEAAHMMVNKRVQQLPVVRDGALVGMVTRSKVLRALHDGTIDVATSERNEEA